MISIICPVYNSENYITKLVDSLARQKMYSESFEIIFIDDGSNDRTLSILESKKSILDNKYSSVKIFKQEHLGPGAARNFGIKESTYDYIAFLDSDDIWYEDKLQICVENIKKGKNIFNCYIHNERYVRSNDKYSIIENGILSDECISKSLYMRNCLSTSAIIVEKNIIEKYRYFDENLQSSQDYDLWLKISPELKICKIDKILGEYIENPDSITSKYYFHRFVDQLVIAIRYRHYVSKYQFIKKVIKIIFSKQWIFGLIRRHSHNY